MKTEGTQTISLEPMEPCNQCITTCYVYRDRWCGACRHKYRCRIRKNKTAQHRIEDGCQFNCTDIEICKEKEE